MEELELPGQGPVQGSTVHRHDLGEAPLLGSHGAPPAPLPQAEAGGRQAAAGIGDQQDPTEGQGRRIRHRHGLQAEEEARHQEGRLDPAPRRALRNQAETHGQQFLRESPGRH